MKTNREYFSYSQYSLWKSSPLGYYKKYVLGQPRFTTKYEWFGKRFMEDLEYDNPIDLPQESLDKIDILEGVEVPLSPNSPFPLFGIVDSLSADGAEFREYKTGKDPWTKLKVARDTQTLFYALLIHKTYNIIPTCKLIWIETAETDEGVIFFTGKVVPFVRTFTLEELVDFEEELRLTLIEIEEYEHEELLVDKDLSLELAELIAIKKEAENRIDVIKNHIIVELINDGMKYGDSPYGRYSITTRETYQYSEEIKEAEDTFKAQIETSKRQEIKEGKATKIKSHSLLFKPKNVKV